MHLLKSQVYIWIQLYHLDVLPDLNELKIYYSTEMGDSNQYYVWETIHILFNWNKTKR